nr:MAG TPA: hypothetical protein [Caudoviricetes sp.]
MIMNIKLNLKNNMAESKKYNSILVSGRKDETLTYSRYIKDEETGKSIKESLDGKMNITDKIEIEQIAQAVWDKLKDEYLRIDGSNFMRSDLSLNNNDIKGVKEIRNINALPIVIAFDKDGYDIKLEKWETSGGDDDQYPRSLGGFDGGSFEVPLDITAVGFKTHNRSVLGLLNNNSEVITAMTDSDIDSCIASVFG